MTLENQRIGFALTGSFCTFTSALACMEEAAAKGAEVTAILSGAADATDSRFMSADALKAELARITGRPIIRTITEAEPIGPQKLFDLLVVLPATGNTLAKIVNGITDTAATMAVKSHLRNNRPVLLGVSTNDALGNSAKNIGLLLNMKHFYFVPFGQDDSERKPKSMVFVKEKAVPAMEAALENRQIQPVIVPFGV